MPTSSAHEHGTDRWLVAWQTAAVSAVLLGVAWLVPIETRNAAGEIREVTAVTVWREMIDNIPADAPFFLTSPVLTILSVIALVFSAWIIVAIARLPQ